MKELIEYKNKLIQMNIEGLLSELELQIKEREYHRFVSKNLLNECEQKILLVKIAIMERMEN